MTRRHLTFGCDGAALTATLDEAPGLTGLLIVSGGNEIRSGAFAGQAMLAAQIAAAGHPVFRFDRRGVGDSEGENAGFTASAPDIAAALAAFRREVPQLARVVALGNCDAASALMLARGAGCDALVLSNPWTFDGDSEPGQAPPAAAIRARYAQRLADPRELWRLVSGGVDLRKLARGVLAALRPAPAPTGLAEAMRTDIGDFKGPVSFLLAGRDRTAQAFAAAWGDDPRIATRVGADHAFSSAEDREWLIQEVLTSLR